jgi:hypothetical protein
MLIGGSKPSYRLTLTTVGCDFGCKLLICKMSDIPLNVVADRKTGLHTLAFQGITAIRPSYYALRLRRQLLCSYLSLRPIANTPGDLND